MEYRLLVIFLVVWTEKKRKREITVLGFACLFAKSMILTNFSIILL